MKNMSTSGGVEELRERDGIAHHCLSKLFDQVICTHAILRAKRANRRILTSELCNLQLYVPTLPTLYLIIYLW